MRECRILVVDGFEDFAVALGAELGARRKVYVARNAEQAKRLVDAAVPLDLAVIEQRLQSPGDRFDISGVELGHWLKTEKGAYVVLLCGQRPQNGLVDTWIRNKWIDECQLKTMRADQRHEHLEQVLAEKIPVNFDLDIQGEHGSILDDEWRQLARAIEPLDGEENATPSWRDLEQIFYRLFPKKFVQSVKILPVPSGAGGGLVWHWRKSPTSLPIWSRA
jgi:hypothetical protein